MIHSGAVVGAGLPQVDTHTHTHTGNLRDACPVAVAIAMLPNASQFQSITFKRIKLDFPYFRSDRYSCSLAACSSAHLQVVGSSCSSSSERRGTLCLRALLPASLLLSELP